MTRHKNLDGNGGAKICKAALEARGKQADARAASVALIIAELQAAGVKSLNGIARVSPMTARRVSACQLFSLNGVAFKEECLTDQRR
jgi:hypothetical protein